MPRVLIPIAGGEGESMSSIGPRNPNSALTLRIPRVGHEHGVQASTNLNNWNIPSTVPRPLIHYADEGGGMQDHPWRLFEERVRTGPFALASFPSQPHSPIRILMLEEGTVNPRLQQFVSDSPPRVRGQWQMGFTPREEELGLTQEELKKAMSKVRKVTFRSTYPKKRGLFSRSYTNTSAQLEKEDDDDKGKQCTICLDAFEPNQEVLVTPCNHMFHSECLVPWVKNHGKCPVCRHALVERRENALSTYSANNNNLTTSGVRDIIALVRAMEEALEWVHLSH